MNTQIITKGSILIAEPYLGDPNFERSVILICEHSDEGSFGLVLNQITNLTLSDVLDDVYAEMPLHLGGPVQQNTLHYIHRRPDLIDNSIRVLEGLYWSGDFEQVKQAVNLGTIKEGDIRFFVGYSGWTGGQLEGELAEKSWFVTQTDADFLFETPAGQFWRGILKRMGGEFKAISNYPVDPRLN